MSRKMRVIWQQAMILAIVFTFLVQFVPVRALAAESDEQEQREKERPEYLGMKLYRGEFHSHTSISDGKLLPEDAFKHVQAQTNLDFFGTAEHEVTFDISSGNDYLEDYRDSYSEEYKFVKDEHDRFNKKTFATIPGVELTWYDMSGHVNIYNAEWFPRTYGVGATGQFGIGDLKYDLPTFYGRIANDPTAIAQLNHPSKSGWGDFNEFRHFNKDVDDNVSLFEYKVSSYFNDFVKALDKGWHLSPTYSGDDHQTNWASGNPAHTGLWTNELTRESVHDAMANRRTYASFDENFILAYSANGQMLGSILPSDTKELNIHFKLEDPDAGDNIDNVTLYTNKGEIVKEYKNINSTTFEQNEVIPAADGEYYFLKVVQADGQEVISAPIWVGSETKGTDHAPEITVNGELPEKVKLGDKVTVPDASTTDDSGIAPTLKIEAFNQRGLVEIVDNQFKIEEYGEYFVRYYSTDSKGNTRAELIRILVDDSKLDGEKILNEFIPIVNVGATEEEVGITLVTDKVLDQAYIQYKTKDAGWNKGTVQDTKVSYFESAYGDSIAQGTYRIHAAHEADLANLKKGTEYDYRYGLTAEGPWSKTYSFETAPESEDTTIYMMGDLQVPDRNKDSFTLFTDMLDVLKQKNNNGKLMIQVGDLVDKTGFTYMWTDVFDSIYKDLNLLSANMIGNHEYVQDEDARRYRNFFNLPENGEGTYSEGNYSFDYGDVHIAVLNSMDFTQAQLKWLEKDMRATDKKWKIVMEHFPYYGGSHSDDPGMNTQRAQMAKVVQQLGVNLHIGGHDHVYKRTTIHNDEVNQSEEAMKYGTTFITMGSSGPKFYDNQAFDWDHIVYDENRQTGAVLEANDESLTFTVYNDEGTVIDTFELTQPENHMKLTSLEVEDGLFKGVGLLNYPGTTEKITMIGAKYDATGTKLIDAQIKEVALEGLGREQVIHFEESLTFDDQNTIKLFIWDNLANQNPLLPSTVVREAMDGEGTAENPYKLDSISDFEKIHYYPDKHYELTADIVGKNDVLTAIGSDGTPFTGVFDGKGHTITGVKMASPSGAGLFSVNGGTIKNLAVLNADINSGTNDAGILVDLNNGTIENSYTTGSITGLSNVGGLVGYSNGVIRNSYSTATVKANAKQAGGLVGITNRGSLTENVYATGSVTAGSSNAGGISGYGYENTIIQNSAAMNTSVITTSSASRIVGRVLSGEKATLENNIASNKMMVSKEAVTAEAPDNEKGLGVSPEQLKKQAAFEELGWDFTNVWTWDESAERPVLQTNQEKIDPEGGSKPTLEKNENGFYKIETAEDLKQVSKFPNANFILQNDIDLTGKTFETLSVDIPFMGTFDGNGKKIIGFKSATGALFHLNGGTIKNVAMIDADVTGEAGAPQTGLLVNVNNGTVENSYSTGKVTGKNTVGGLVGYSNGVVRNSYSNADVTAEVSQAGGVVGITNSGSLTENVYATGKVQALKSNAGGITGYGYNDTVVQNVIALNQSVTTPSSANRVVGRVLAGNKATLLNNYAFAEMVVDVERITEDSPITEKGAGLPRLEVQDKNTYSQLLGWDFETTWIWDAKNKKPVLRVHSDIVEEEEPDAPALEKNANGFYQIEKIEDLAEINAYPREQYILMADLDLTTAKEPITILNFHGVLDGNGKRLVNYQSNTGALIEVNNGTIQNIGMVDANVDSTNNNVGILVNTNNGKVENSFSTGKITGKSTVGGLVGYSYGEIRNSYSTADVTAKEKQSGGLVGITGRGSTTEYSFASGTVNSVISNAGGFSGYGYTTTVIQYNAALNPSVTTVTAANRIVGRVLAGDTATLTHNIANADMVVSKEWTTAEDANNEKGLGKTAAELQTQETFEKELGWNFENNWVWDTKANRPELRIFAASHPDEPTEPVDAPNLSKDADGFYMIKKVDDVKEINKYPNEQYRLTANLDFSGANVSIPTFAGTFDGNGKSISHYQSATGGLFGENTGTIQNVAMVDANVTTANSNVGILVNTNRGVVESSYSTGSMTGTSTVGGLVGHSHGEVRNSYSTADVLATSKQAGGLVGITNKGSKTTNSYASGTVHAGESNAGGLSGYGYVTTEIRGNVALNQAVLTTSAANRIVGRVGAGQTATLVDNLASNSMIVSKEGVTTEGADNEKGLGKAIAELQTVASFEAIGWDFTNVWAWDAKAKRPVLVSNKENTEASGGATAPALEKDGNGFYIIDSADDLQAVNQFPSGSYILQADLDLAGKKVSILSDVFTGVFDGNGKIISNFTSTTGALFDLNAGTIKNLGMVNANVVGTPGMPQTGILVNTNNGTVENSYSTGQVSGTQTTGGLVGYSNGIVRNSYSTANVHSKGSQAGGLIGITNTGSITENSFAAGAVSAAKSNAGGISGYAYQDTIIRNTIALNESVTASSSANRVVGKVLSGETAILVNNLANAGMTVTKEAVTTESTTNEKGQGITLDVIDSQGLYTEQLSWDFENIWTWNEQTKRPELR
ncbi:GLUG motif-containing protein [Bacillus sp. REN16]|uniref:GLUG motif-containing protein n=1 Tax=Bacillus sp. REN16 TaxID=2887296 RepID=UPI001E640647|nr:GLUG motif-containing protein [Bacillus sp. REN16]MCC3356112.1 metallophosphoesterase [Bacillus sp. REN16]